jgi:hypothetical protein
MDSMLYGFKKAKGVHGKILTAIEDGKVLWLKPQAITELRKVHAQRPLTLAELEEQRKEEQRNCKQCDKGNNQIHNNAQ